MLTNWSFRVDIYGDAHATLFDLVLRRGPRVVFYAKKQSARTQYCSAMWEVYP